MERIGTKDHPGKEVPGRPAPTDLSVSTLRHLLSLSNKSYHDLFYFFPQTLFLTAPSQTMGLPTSLKHCIPSFTHSFNSFNFRPLCQTLALALPGSLVSQPSVTSPTSLSPPQKGPGTHRHSSSSFSCLGPTPRDRKEQSCDFGASSAPLPRKTWEAEDGAEG